MSIGYANTYDLDIGGGGSEPGTPLVPGTNPAAQYVASGTTSIVFAFPAASGGAGSLTYDAPTLTKPSGSSATVSGTAPGNITINNAADGESYLVRVYVTDGDGQEVLNDAIGAVTASVDVLPQLVPPARQSLASSATSASATFTQPGAPVGVVYSVAISNVTTGASVVPSSGSGLGAYVFPVTAGNDYIVVLTATALDGQIAKNVAQVAVADVAVISWTAPNTASGSAGTTSLDIVWNAAMGGVSPFVYDEPATLYDSQAASTTALYSTAGVAPGTTTVSGLVNGQSIVVSRTVTDAAGETLTVTAIVVVNAGAATVTSGAAPAGQTISGFDTSATIGSWGAASGGTGPYTYVVTDLTGLSVVAGSGLGPYTASGLSAGNSYIYRMAVTDSLGAKGYSYTTVTVSAVPTGWILEDETDFTDADWTAFSSTSTTVSSVAWYATLYGADGVTPRAYLRNNTAAVARIVDLTPSGSGLRLAATSTAGDPAIGVWPAGWTAFLNGSRNDVFLVQAIVSGVNPAGTSTVVEIVGLSTVDSPSSPLTGLRASNSGTAMIVRAASYVAGFTDQTFQSFPTGVKRVWLGEVQIAVAAFRRQTVYFNANNTTFGPIESGQRVLCQATSTSMTAPGGSQTTSAAWGAEPLGTRTCFVLYNNLAAAATSDEGAFLRKIRLYRLPGGSR
jgi:hypothetical protein